MSYSTYYKPLLSLQTDVPNGSYLFLFSPAVVGYILSYNISKTIGRHLFLRRRTSISAQICRVDSMHLPAGIGIYVIQVTVSSCSYLSNPDLTPKYTHYFTNDLVWAYRHLINASQQAQLLCIRSRNPTSNQHYFVHVA